MDNDVQSLRDQLKDARVKHGAWSEVRHGGATYLGPVWSHHQGDFHWSKRVGNTAIMVLESEQ